MTTDQDRDRLYLEYLYDYVGLPKRGRSRSYFQLFDLMQSKEFSWMLVEDTARAHDGQEMRWEFVEASRLRKVPAEWMYLPCTFLEMLIGVARRLQTLTDGDIRAWFMQLLYNLNLDMATDIRFDTYVGEAENKMDMVVWRTYSSNGSGGLFPLERPETDQRKTDIWYQLNAWLIEKDRNG